jgi:stalled ribosome rescue protein Dom34
MKENAGLWIDHREAIIVVLSKTGEATKCIQSDVEKQLRRSSEPSNGKFKGHEAPADDSRENEYTGQLAHYYDNIVSYLRDAGSILILGPGEAKGELKKRFEKHGGQARSISMETVDKMTESEVVAQVRRHFQPDAARRGA